MLESESIRMDTPSRFMLTSIAWNKHKWKDVDTESPTGHRYTQRNPGHESFNFAFDKPNLDDRMYVYGYSAGMRRNPQRFLQPGMVFFYSHNYSENTNHIVGVYGNARRLEDGVYTSVDKFGTEELYSNIIAEQNYSALFPRYLDADTYKGRDWTRMVPQGGIRYIDRDTAGQIMDDVVEADDNRKLRRIKSLVDDGRADDYAEQEHIVERHHGDPRNKMNWKPVPLGITDYAAKVRLRDNQNIALLKKQFNYQCQICDKFIITKRGGRYIEAAHIHPKREGGSEVPSNILILCPNCHKEFDYGDVKITKHTDSMVRFTMNDVDHSIELVSPDGW